MHTDASLDKTAEQRWDYIDQLAENSQSWVCNMNFEDSNSNAREEEQIEPFAVSEGIDLELEKVVELEWSNELNVQCSPQEIFTCSPDSTFNTKTLEEPLLKIVQSPFELDNQLLLALDDINTPIDDPPL